jgi:hypothetical protein
MTPFELMLLWLIMYLLFFILEIFLMSFVIDIVKFIFHLIDGVVCYFFDCDKYP